jgi:hypothetical protein
VGPMNTITGVAEGGRRRFSLSSLGSCSCGIKRALSLSLSLSLSLFQRQETLYGITPLDCPPISLHSFAFLFLIIIPSLHTLYTSLLINSKLPGNSQKNQTPYYFKILCTISFVINN